VMLDSPENVAKKTFFSCIEKHGGLDPSFHPCGECVAKALRQREHETQARVWWEAAERLKNQKSLKGNVNVMAIIQEFHRKAQEVSQ